DPDGVEGAIDTLRGYDIPLSIDTMEKQNIERALDSDIDMIMSFDHRLLNQFNDIKTPIVVIPKKETIPKDYNKKIQILEENIKLAKSRGFKNIIADLILEPLNFGFTDSVTAYRIFSNNHKMPILLGTGNVTELMDADSVGINALLSGIAMECDASIVFTPEQSDKAQGSTNELATASKMMYLTRRRGSAPKDLGLDLLRLKDKRVKREEFKEELYNNAGVIQAKMNKRHGYDPKGFFKIFVGEDIKAVHYKKEKPKFVIKGASAKEISDMIFSMALVSDISHALYLGRELEKAEVALKTGKSYVQDMGVF
ncbi:MAG: dihydropteroate synthase-like protein, partial [Candidatus Hydrothermarchaeales archaeon]